MAPIRYSLHYEDYSEHMMSRFGKLLQMQSLVDMTLMCSSHTLRVHKAVLAASSAYFQEVLQKQTGEPLIILKMRFSVLKCLVEFMYCGKTQCLEEHLDELVAAAHFLKIKGLSKVTKEGLGIANHDELPVFTPPVVIDRPPQSFIDLHTQVNSEPPPQPVMLVANANANVASADLRSQHDKDMVVRIPIDIASNGAGPSGSSSIGIDYSDIKPRRGRPSVKRGGGIVGAWEGASVPTRSAERAQLRREHDSRKAIHRLRHLQARHLQDYMDHVSLTQAVNSICGPDTSGAGYTPAPNDFMYMDQGVVNSKLNKRDSTVSCPSDALSNINGGAEPPNQTSDGVNTVMSQYVNALKSAGLPTDLPILFEAGDGTYINVNEEVLLDMVQSGEIQYEVIEQPNIIEKVADPTEIKSIDDLSKSIERGEMLLNTKSFASVTNFGKDHYSRDEVGIDSLDAILSDNLESFGEQQNYVVLESRLQDNTSIDHVNATDFSCIDGDMFTKTMNDDVKKYYEDRQLHDAEAIAGLCPTTSALETNYASLLNSKTSLITDNIVHQYGTLNSEDLRENAYDYALQLPQNNDFKEDPLESLIATAKENLDNPPVSPKPLNDSDSTDAAKRMLNELIYFNDKIEKAPTAYDKVSHANEEFVSLDLIPHPEDLNLEHSSVNSFKACEQNVTAPATDQLTTKETWDDGNKDSELHDNNTRKDDTAARVVDLAAPEAIKMEIWHGSNEAESKNKENVTPNLDNINISTLQDDIPFAVGLLPLKHAVDDGCLKRKTEEEPLDATDNGCSKRSMKHKKW